MFWIKDNKTEVVRLKELYPTSPILLLGDYCYVFRDVSDCYRFLDRNHSAQFV